MVYPEDDEGTEEGGFMVMVLPPPVTFNLRFPGQYYDTENKLFYNLNRYYNPELGRYMEPDPIGLEGGLNVYNYVAGNPVDNVDPSGLCLGPLVIGCYELAVAVTPTIGRFVYLNAPRIGAFIEGLSPAAAGSVSVAGAASAISKVEGRATSEATSVMSAAKLRTQLSAEEMAFGHAFSKHVGEFKDIGISNKEQFQRFAENVITNPSSVRYASDGRIFYLQESTKTIAIRNPNAEGTIFRPKNWSNYINSNSVPKRALPYER